MSIKIQTRIVLISKLSRFKDQKLIKTALSSILDLRYPLKVFNDVGGSVSDTYPIHSDESKVHLRLQLPPNLVCTQCILQWTYVAGNNWGVDPETGQGCLGCGNMQENFRACADISINVNQPPNVPALTIKSIIVKQSLKKRDFSKPKHETS